MFKYLSGVQIAIALLSKPRARLRLRLRVYCGNHNKFARRKSLDRPTTRRVTWRGHLAGILSRWSLFEKPHCTCCARSRLVFGVLTPPPKPIVAIVTSPPTPFDKLVALALTWIQHSSLAPRLNWPNYYVISCGLTHFIGGGSLSWPDSRQRCLLRS